MNNKKKKKKEEGDNDLLSKHEGQITCFFQGVC